MAVIIDWNLVCLVCLQFNESNMHSVHSKDESDTLISEKLIKCSNDILIDNELNIPQQICDGCYSDLDAAYRFHKNCEESISIYRQIFEENTVPADDAEPEGDCTKAIRIPPWLMVKRSQIDDVLKEEEMQTEDDNEEAESEQVADELKFDDGEINIEDEYFPNDNKSDTSDDANCREEEEEHVQENSEERDNVKPKKSRRKQLSDKSNVKICEICGNSYKYQYALDNHMRRHRNERPFRCEFCDKAFVANVELRRHMRVHTGQKPYACQYCERKFSDFGNRIKHERTHTGERPYVCKVCGKSFAYPHVLTIHKSTHTGEKKFKCHLCDRGFTKKVYLQSHLANHQSQPNCQIKEETDALTYDRQSSPANNLTTSEEIYIIHEEPGELQIEDIA